MAQQQQQSSSDIFDNYQAQFIDQKAIAQNHMLTLNAIKDGFPNTEALAALVKTEAALKDRAASIKTEIDMLENKAAATDIEFEEEAPEATGEPRERIYVLQDYILAILTFTFVIFYSTLFFYVGKTSHWNKKTLAYMLGGGIIFVAISFALLKTVG
jgi:hypothetical protein